MTKTVCFVAALIFSLAVAGQSRYTLSGYVKDSLSGETLIGASVTINGASAGIVTNPYGFYSITLPAGSYVLSVSFAGYFSLDTALNLNANEELNFNLFPRGMLQEVVVS